MGLVGFHNKRVGSIQNFQKRYIINFFPRSILKILIICKFDSLLDWTAVSRFVNLNLVLLKIYKNKLDWNIISEYRCLSEDILEEFKDQIDFDLVEKNKIGE